MAADPRFTLTDSALEAGPAVVELIGVLSVAYDLSANVLTVEHLAGRGTRTLRLVAADAAEGDRWFRALQERLSLSHRVAPARAEFWPAARTPLTALVFAAGITVAACLLLSVLEHVGRANGTGTVDVQLPWGRTNVYVNKPAAKFFGLPELGQLRWWHAALVGGTASAGCVAWLWSRVGGSANRVVLRRKW